MDIAGIHRDSTKTPKVIQGSGFQMEFKFACDS